MGVKEENIEYVKNLISIFCEKYYPEYSVHIMIDGTIGVIKKNKHSCTLISKLLVNNDGLYKFKGYNEFDYDTFMNFLKGDIN